MPITLQKASFRDMLLAVAWPECLAARSSSFLHMHAHPILLQQPCQERPDCHVWVSQAKVADPLCAANAGLRAPF